jgi:methylase of polypeptide subunit release factors
MPIPKIEERTLYPPLVNYLKTIGFKAIGESKIIRKSPDIVFHFDSISFVIEVKIGKTEIGLKAVAQASDYARKLNTQNIIILIYPEKYRNEPITDDTVVDKIALDVDAYALVLTEYWTESLVIKPLDLFKKLKQQLILKEVKIDFKTTVELIGNYVKELNSIIYEKAKEELVSEVVNKLDLFSSIGDLKDKETAEKQVKNLASYLLFNQLLFFHIYTKKDKTASLPELEIITDIKNIQMYFNSITKIDYQSIYRVNILGHIPKSKIVIDTLNEVIKGIKLLRAEYITQDLAGRFFHELIPFEVRKILAAFYTHPIAAELLAGLAIDSYDEAILDPACGSGTLLVASYKRKQNLYEKLYGYKDNMEMHKNFIENEITGIDIMPFAAHISAINLTMQNIEQETNRVRIATLDSLEMVESLKSLKFKRNGIEISPYSSSIQLTLDELYGKPIIIDKKGAVSAKGKGSEFYLKPVDTIIMNPPFSDREKMPVEMRGKLKTNPLGDVCGHRINLWGYFLALTDLLLKPNGIFGAVIPFNIARGKATEKIRHFLLENYKIRYLVKPIKDVAFSENASFMDILLIAEKRKPKKNDKTGIIYLKRSIRDLSLQTVKDLITEIKEKSENFRSDTIDLIFIDTKEFLEHKENLMPLIGMFNPDNIKLFEDFSVKFRLQGGIKLTKLKELEISEGFHASPAGLSQISFITSPYIKNRVGRAFLIYESEDEKYINVKIKKADLKLKIEKSKVIPALRTLTGIDTFYVDKIDYFIKKEPKDLQKILILSKFKNKDKFNWKLITEKLKGKEIHLSLARRFRPDSSNTHFFAFYSDNRFVSPHTFKILKTDKTESKFQCLFLNSVITLKNIITLREQTTEGFTDIMETELNLFDAFNINNLTVEDKKKLDECFDYLKNVKFPSLLEQLENRFKGRIELDKTVLKVLGFDKKEINNWLPKIYDALIEELKIMKNVK